MMKKFTTLSLAFLTLGLIVAVAWFIPFSSVAEYFNDDPDIPDFIKKAKSQFTKEEYRHRRSEQIDLYRGMADGDRGEKIEARNQAIARMAEQEGELRARPSTPTNNAILAAWTALGPDPIPN